MSEAAEVLELWDVPEVLLYSCFYRSFRLYVQLSELVNGSKKKVVIDRPDVAAWERPIVNMEIPRGARPGDCVLVKKAWTANGVWKGADVVFHLALKCAPNVMLYRNDVFMWYSVVTKMDRFVKTIQVSFPSGRVERVELQKIVHDTVELIYEGEGLPYPNNVRKRGNFKVFITADPKQSKLIGIFQSKPLSTTRRRRNTC